MASPPDNDQFSHSRALTNVQNVLSENGDIVMSSYAALVEEISTLFKSFAKDQPQVPPLPEIQENVELLKELSGGDFGPDYATAQNMLDYETRNNLVQPHTGLPSGTHTLLRFHRIFELLHRVLKKVLDASIPDEDVSAEAIKAYSATLGRFGSQLMVICFMTAVPTFVLSRAMLMKHAGFATDPARFWAWLRQMTAHAKKLNDAVQALYEQHQLHDLPLD